MNRKLFLRLAIVNIVFIVFHIAWSDRFDLLNLDRERTPAAYWSGLQLMAIAAFGVTMAILSASRRTKILWCIFSFLFISFSFDEVSELHENIAYYVTTYGSVPVPELFRTATYDWLILLSPFILFSFSFLFFFARTLQQEDRRARRTLTLGLCLFLAAIGLEVANGLDASQRLYLWFVVFEESLELFGEAIVLASMAMIVRNRFDMIFIRRGVFLPLSKGE